MPIDGNNDRLGARRKMASLIQKTLTLQRSGERRLFNTVKMEVGSCLLGECRRHLTLPPPHTRYAPTPYHAPPFQARHSRSAWMCCWL